MGCCGCCAPRYKRLVDSVFPRDPQDGLVKGNMEKLTFYVLSSPEKLDRVGEYLYQRVSRDIYRKKPGFIVIGVESMDQLLQACHSQTLNLFVESFLRMVQKLLESPDPNLQILATQSFVKFSSIEEDTPSYHRRYDFFVSKFASMCHNNSPNDDIRNEIRAAGTRGLRSVVRKTVSDDLVENIWDSSHMEKIIPSLLFNMEQGRQGLVADENDASTENQNEEEMEAPRLAENCMRDLVNKATFGHVRSFVKPVLHHFDTFELWVPNDFAVHTFRVIMFSIQSQYSYAVIETLMNHLDQHHMKSSAKVRTSMGDVLAKIIDIAAGESVGPSVLEIVNSIVQHIQVSTKLEGADSDEKAYRETLIAALGEYVTHLPDYQKIEIMKFIMQKVPSRVDNSSSQRLLQSMLLKSLLMVGSKYHTTYLSTTFPLSFLQPLLTMCQDEDAELRLLVQNILHTLIDRHQNRERLSSPTITKLEHLKRESCTRTDILFVKKNGSEIFTSLVASVGKNNNAIGNMNAIYTTIALFLVELFCEDTLVDFIRVIISFQDLALTSASLSATQKIHLHVMSVSLFAVIAQCFPAIQDYKNSVVKARRELAAHLIPPMKVRYEAYEPSQNIAEPCLFRQDEIFAILKNEGLEVSSNKLSYSVPRHSWVDAHMQSGSTTDLNSFSMEVDSGASTPIGSRKMRPEREDEEMTVENLKRLLNDSSDIRKEIEVQKRKELTHAYKTANFEDLVAKTAAKQTVLQEIHLPSIISTAVQYFVRLLPRTLSGESFIYRTIIGLIIARCTPNKLRIYIGPALKLCMVVDIEFYGKTSIVSQPVVAVKSRNRE
ncbi:unnamed protein product [Allacma fusca]|uniref:EFR3-like protein n=1 Tax=Allacma fusca TaxID=39272 RepID=A0A8J2KTN3_9HEXA|nr:unnamed protein product [Allacma fusca]